MLRIVHPVSKCAHKINNFGEIVGGLSVIEGWEDSETTGAIVGGELFAIGYNENPELMFPWPVKILNDVTVDRVAYDGRRFIAVRTDCFPLLWIAFWLQIRVEAKAQNDIARVIVIANLFGWAETPYWARPHWRDFLFVPRVNKDNPNQSNVK
jgi:hypothetical protein